jgi:hypothetical protein
MNQKERDDAVQVFRLLGLETEADRRHFRRLGNLEDLGSGITKRKVTPADTRNHTATESHDAQLESTSE